MQTKQGCQKFAPVGHTEQVDDTVGTTNEAGDVHVGHGSCVPVAAWNRLPALGSDSTFCKQLAVCLWGKEILAQRSLTGTLSNNAISKGMAKIHPPLSPLKVASVSRSRTPPTPLRCYLFSYSRRKTRHR
ncbi:hypothetical protein V5799_002244 [Amblyomma americanum]|uniref:Uncharacterized protein n=1 Tax=Amblyomma americanum TaxID=6943 RepID=A0AAQ4CXW5_AMBAM